MDTWRLGVLHSDSIFGMHGATVVQAREAVDAFLKNARDQDKRVVRILPLIMNKHIRII